ncbi:Transposase DDE domain-containing protein [Methylobacterium gossipiicola]|uniref:Transposase DDE domain-containing protein n=2 Tax=Methylobacterium gossipiicola TaxID=582675 RepID=A0A1I2R6S9_9HYPH|nr:transposase [Methylobacterium gossipiicola]SFG34297.1 Transposase DDE domain-containing protein [Methylobacterium gossipiicola]
MPRRGARSAGRGGSSRASPEKAIESSEKLGRHRWVVERTHAWFNRFRRLPIRYERRADIYEAFTSLITLNQIRRFC